MEAMVPAPAEKESSGGRPAKKRRYDSTNWSSHWFFCKFIKQNVIRTLLFFQFYVQQVRFISVDQSIKARLPEYKIPEQHDNFKILKFSIQIQMPNAVLNLDVQLTELVLNVQISLSNSITNRLSHGNCHPRNL